MRTTRRRARGPRVLLALALAGLAGAGAWVVLSRPKPRDVQLVREAAKSFDLADLPETPAPPPAPAPVPKPVSSLDVARPVAPARMARPEAAAAPDRQAWALKALRAFLRAPARAMTARSSRLSSATRFKAFLADKKSVDAYLNAPLVRAALNSPAVAKALAGDPAVVSAFLSTPAMKDRSAVKALAGSALVKKILDCPGPQGAMQDQAVIAGLTRNPAAVRFMSENPEAAKILGLRLR